MWCCRFCTLSLLLKIYSFGISDHQLLEIKDILSQYFAEKATEEMDKLWDSKNWSNETMDNWLKEDAFKYSREYLEPF